MAEIDGLLKLMTEKGSSDLHVKAGSPPAIRLNGKLVVMREFQPLTADATQVLAAGMMDERQKVTFENHREVDFAYSVSGVGRFRVNVFHQRGSVGMTLRRVSTDRASVAELGLPPVVTRLADEPRGLVLVTGTAGSGKTTTLAAMVDHINSTREGHIVTIEDPIEFVFRDRRSIVDQREIGTDTPNFLVALKMAVRQSPDVILIGEMRDRETMEAALAAAETGHLVMSTLHTVNATQTVERIIHFFPPHQHELIRLQLSLVLAGVVSQRLIPRKGDSGRLPAVELMIQSPTIRELIRKGMTQELYNAVKDGEYFGCQTFNQSLKKLYQQDLVSLEHAIAASDYPDELKLDLKGIFKGATVSDFNFNY